MVPPKSSSKFKDKNSTTIKKTELSTTKNALSFIIIKYVKEAIDVRINIPMERYKKKIHKEFHEEPRSRWYLDEDDDDDGYKQNDYADEGKICY